MKRMTVLALMVCLLPAPTGAPRADLYVEDFSSLAYCDAANTTAWWDTAQGELKLPPFSPELLGGADTPGESWGIALEGPLLLVADMQGGLLSFDINDPSAPLLLGILDTPGSARRVELSGDRAYIADMAGGLLVVDVTNPAAMSILSAHPTPDLAYAVDLCGPYAYVAVGSAGVWIADVRDPEAPVFAGAIDTPSAARDLCVDDQNLYVADRNAGLQVIDVSDPTHPLLAGGMDTAGLAYGIAVDGDLGFIADGEAGLVIVDVSRPEAPVLLATLDTPGQAWQAIPCGDHLYLADAGGGLRAVDITDPTQPQPEGSWSGSGAVYAVYPSGDRAYVADGAAGLAVLRIAEAVVPPVLWGIADMPGGDGRQIAVAGDRAFLACGPAGMAVYDISDPSTPALLASLYLPDHTYGLTLDGNYAYLAGGRNGAYGWLQVADVSDPAHPAIVSPEILTLGANKMARIGDRLFLGGGASQYACFWEFDISDPTNPDLIYAGGEGTTEDLVACGSRRFLLHSEPEEYGGTIEYFGVSDYTNPAGSWVGHLYLPQYNRSIAAYGDWAYISSINGYPPDFINIRIVDMRIPQAFAVVDSVSTLSCAEAFGVAGHHLFASIGSRIEVFDLSEPWLPQSLGGADIRAGGSRYVFAGDHLFLNSGDSLQVVRAYDRSAGDWPAYGQSLPLPSAGEPIASVRLTAVQTAGVSWQISADGGVNWQSIPPDGSWQTLGVPGSALVWRSTHEIVDLGTNPSVDALTVEWEYAGTAAPDAAAVALVLYQNAPNPFNPATTIRFALPSASQATLDVLDTAGRRVALLVDEALEAGAHEVVWRGLDEKENPVASGLYMVRLSTSCGVETRKMLLLQ